MKLKQLIALTAVGVMALTGCGSNEKTNEVSSATPENTETVEDEATIGGEDSAETEAVRIVSATVAATQVLDKLDAELVGVPKTSNTLPERYQGIEEVGMAMDPDLEKIVSLNPDIVVIDQHFKEKVDVAATELGLNVFYFDTTSYDNFLGTIEDLGAAINKTEEAAAFISDVKEAETEILANAEGKEAPTVAVVFGSSSSFMLATDLSYIGDLVNRVGAENITNALEAEPSSGYIQFSLEQIIEQNPDYVLRFAHGNIEETKKSFDEFFSQNPAWDSLDAVKEGRVIDLDSSIFNTSANIYMVDALNELGRIFYGE